MWKMGACTNFLDDDDDDDFSWRNCQAAKEERREAKPAWPSGEGAGFGMERLRVRIPLRAVSNPLVLLLGLRTRGGLSV